MTSFIHPADRHDPRNVRAFNDVDEIGMKAVSALIERGHYEQFANSGRPESIPSEMDQHGDPNDLSDPLNCEPRKAHYIDPRYLELTGRMAQGKDPIYREDDRPIGHLLFCGDVGERRMDVFTAAILGPSYFNLF
jgi:hypothetical protein